MLVVVGEVGVVAVVDLERTDDVVSPNLEARDDIPELVLLMLLLVSPYLDVEPYLLDPARIGATYSDCNNVKVYLIKICVSAQYIGLLTLQVSEKSSFIIVNSIIIANFSMEPYLQETIQMWLMLDDCIQQKIPERKDKEKLSSNRDKESVHRP